METIAENIAKLYDDLDGKANRKAVFKHYYLIDESSLYPILGKFNVTQRAIRKLHRFERDGGYYLTGLELCYFIDNQISLIVNTI